MAEWFERWFGEEYLSLYPHRDQQEALKAIELILASVDLPAGSLVLDLACGAGRHTTVLEALGRRSVGLDLSMPLLSRARRRQPRPTGLVRADMRQQPFRDQSFHAAVNLFTSFGYFSEDSEHLAVIRETARVLKREGIFVMDYLNATWVANTLVPTERQKLGTHAALIERRITDDARFVEKVIRLEDDGRSFTERVRLFSGAQLTGMFRATGLDVVRTFGNYDGAVASDDQPRMILIAHKRA